MSALGHDREVDRSEPGGITVRTAWLPELRCIADARTLGGGRVPAGGWALDGARLRWWCLAEGSVGGGPAATMYTLALGPNDAPAWLAVGAALASAGVAGVLVGPRADGPAYRIVGQRRLGRLRELVGDPPAGVPDDGWPPVPTRS